MSHHRAVAAPDGYTLVVGRGRSRHIPDDHRPDQPACNVAGGTQVDSPNRNLERLPKCRRCQEIVDAGIVPAPVP